MPAPHKVMKPKHIKRGMVSAFYRRKQGGNKNISVVFFYMHLGPILAPNTLAKLEFLAQIAKIMISVIMAVALRVKIANYSLPFSLALGRILCAAKHLLV